MLTLRLLDFGRTTHVDSGVIYLEKGAKFAYGVGDPALTERLKLLHALKGRDCGQWYPVVVVGRVEAPHKPGGH